MRQTNILLILEATVGGAYKHVMLLARSLPKEKYRVTVLLSHLRDSNSIEDIRQLEQDGIRVYDIPMKRDILLISDLKSFLEIVRVFKKQSFDIVHTHSSKAGFIGRMAASFFNFKVVHTPHCFAFQSKRGLSKYFFVFLEQFAASFCERIVAVSKGEYDLILKECIAPGHKICLIENAICETEIVLTEQCFDLKKKLGIPPLDKIVIGVGRLTKQKGWTQYIEIAAEVLSRNQQVTFLIIGDGEEYENLSNLIQKLGLESKIILTGYLKEIYDVYNIADVFISTSVWEGLPYVILEAMTMKLPVIATNIPGNKDLIRHNENGFLFELGYYKDAAEILKKLLSNEALMCQIGERGYANLKQTSTFDRFLRDHMNLYQSILNL